MLLTILLLGMMLLLTLLFRGNWQGPGDGDRLSITFRLSSTVRRFPFAVAATLFITSAGIVLTGKTDSPAIWTSLLGPSLLVLPLLVSARLLSERDGQRDFRPDRLTTAITVIGFLYFIFLHQVQSCSFILGFCGVGIVTYLCSYGVTATENRLQSLLRKLFFPLVLPLTPMLFPSVWRRVSEYGVTETRYFGILSEFWLAAVSLYYIISRRKDPRIVPASLCLIITLVSFDPWGVLSTSTRSQTGRLQGLLQEAGLLENGSLRPSLNTEKPAEGD